MEEYHNLINGKYEMSKENYNGSEWTEIPKYLYEALLKYYEEEQ